MAKIKRFGFGKHEIPLDNGAKLMVPAITERQDGEYVLYADYQKLLSQIEAIGAGGVSGQKIIKNSTTIPARWYAVSKTGMATLCISEDDAKNTAAEADLVTSHHHKPHIAVLLAPATQEDNPREPSRKQPCGCKTAIAKRKTQSIKDFGYEEIESATVLVKNTGEVAVINRGGTVYWLENSSIAQEITR